MRITINNEFLETPEHDMNIRDLLEWRNVPDSGTAVALNNKLVPRTKWDSTYLREDDVVTLISAAFGG